MLKYTNAIIILIIEGITYKNPLKGALAWV